MTNAHPSGHPTGSRASVGDRASREERATSLHVPVTESSGVDVFVDPLVGIVVEASQPLEDLRSPRLHSTIVVVADPELTVGSDVEFGGGGTGGDARHARWAAIGEAVERYSASYVDHRRIMRATESDLRERCVTHVELSRLRLYTDAQLAAWQRDGGGYTAGHPGDVIAWIESWSLTHRRATLVPADFVFLAPARLDGDPHLCPQISTGLALDASTAAATLSGLLECLERDAFTLTWELAITPRRIDVHSDPGLFEAIDDHLCSGTGVQWTALALEHGLDVPVAMVCCHLPGDDGVGLAVGAAAALHPARAVDKAAREAFQSLQWARMLREGGEAPPNADEITTFEHHVRYWADPARARDAGFLTASTSTVAVDDLCAVLAGDDADAALDALVAQLAALGVEVLAVDVTSPDVAAAGFHVVRVLTPDLCLLDVEARARFHGRPRLAQVAARLGVAGLNPLPHPFP